MHANETHIQRILDGVQQYVVPLFQRPYSWEPRQWQALWDDLNELCKDEGSRNHFIGSIVTMPERSVPEGVSKFVLIDGQQRITTLLVLLAAIRDRARHQQSKLADKIDDLLLKNRYQDDLDIYKLLPTQTDRAEFRALMDGGKTPQDGQVVRAYAFFEKRLRDRAEVYLERLHDVIRNRIVLVSIVLSKDDNPYLIFESLNAKGQPLTQADLIRNFLFMHIHRDQQEEIYKTTWMPMQMRLATNLTEFIRHHLMRDGKRIRQTDIYCELKERFGDKEMGEIVAYLRGLSGSSLHYAKLLDPVLEPCEQIADRLIRLNRFEATTTYPFLLSVYQDHEAGTVSESEFSEILDVLECFLIRRFVCNIPTNILTRIFIQLYAQAKEIGPLAEGVKAVLKDKGFPRDREFREQFVSFKLYGGGDRIPKTKLILERLEQSFGHKEVADLAMLNIEHVMPQTLTEWWKQALGDDWEGVYENWIDTVGNLTLTGYNPELSNADFPAKKSILQRSHIELSRHFADMDGWGGDAILQRGEALADRALFIWPDFARRDSSGDTPEWHGEQEQEGVQHLIETILEDLGHNSIRVGHSRFLIHRTGDGKVVNIKYSKRHSKYYWYGIHASLWTELTNCGATHVVFIANGLGYMTVPITVVAHYLAAARVSRASDGTVRHYHLTISPEPELELFISGEAIRVPLKPYFKAFDE